MKQGAVVAHSTRVRLALLLAVVVGLFVALPALAAFNAEYLEPGPAIPPRPPWPALHRDIPWWFADAAGQSDIYDVSVIWANKINAGGTSGDYESAIISPPSPVGNGGTVGTTQDLRWWPAGTPNAIGTFTTPDWNFLVTYDWDPTANGGTGGATATIVLTESTSGTTRTATADVTQRVLAFVNAGDPDGAGPFSPYQETHIQEDILLRLAVADDSTTYPNTSVRIRDLELKTGGGAFESIIIDNDSDSDQAVNATDDTANRQVGLIFINDALTDHTTDMQMRGKLNFGYTRAGTAGGPPNGANIMFEVKLGDLDPATSDFGDLPDTSSSTGPGNYQTLAANSGPSHVLINGVRLGAAIDDETDGAQSSDATGDDTTDTPDDEDGVTFLTPMVPGTNADIRFNVNDPDGTACVSLFADYDADGDFADSGEHAINQQSYATGNQTATIAVPDDTLGVATRIGVRVRLTDTCAQGGQNLTGAAPNGEIEDYMLGWIGNYVWDDADGNGVQAFTGEPGINDVVVNLLDGSGDPVLDGDGNPITTMTAWDAFGSAGRYQFGGLPPGNYIVEFVAPTGKDFTGQDQGGNDEVDSDANPTTGRSHVISLDTGEFDDSVDAGLVNEAVDVLDFGDLPDTGAGTSAGNYQTLSGDNGPSHVIVSGLSLGANIDDETNAAQNATATGDDTAGTPDDEDGVTILRPLVAGRNALIQFTVNDPDGNACVSLYVDYNGDGDFADFAETPIPNFGYASGSQTAAFNVPASAVGLIGMRMRLTDECSQGGQTPTGAATNGEVEDYLFGAIGNYVWDDTDGDGIQDGDESGVSGVVVHLLDGNGDPVLDGNNQPITKTTNANGGYEFGGLPPGIYYVVFDAPTGKDFTIQGQGTAATDSDAYPPTGQSNAINLGAGEVDDTIDAGLVNEPPPPTYDWGDLPDAGVGQGTGDYMTLSADNGPNHVIVSGLGLGANLDDEADGQPNATAEGDDSNNLDDEDGLTFLTPLSAGSLLGREAAIQLTVNDPDGTPCVNMWVDLNSDGYFDFNVGGQPERVVQDDQPTGANPIYTFDVPYLAHGIFGVRVRVTDECGQGGGLAYGPATNGEVEDYILGAIGDTVWDDADGDGIQDGSESGINGVVVNLLDGSGNPVLDNDGNPITTTTYWHPVTSAPGFYEFAGLPPGNYIVEFVAPTGKDFTQTGQGTAATDSNANVTTGRSGVVAIGVGEYDETIDAGLINEPPPPPTEDYGDLPDANSSTGPDEYQTQYVYGGPSHTVVSGLRLGPAIDAEYDGQQSLNADGDDAAGTPDDEDGVTFLTPLMAGKNADVRFNVNDPDGNACVSLFADFNADGDFADSGEHAVNQQSYATGNQTATFAVPASAGGVIAVRVRLTDECNQGGQLSTDPAPNGEVEDYLLGEIGDYVWQDADGDGIQQGFELGVSGVVVNLLDGSGDPVLDGDGNPITTTTDANGKYQFTGLPAGNYIIEFVAPTGKDFTQTGQGTAATDSDADTTTGRSGVVNISIREVDHTIDAGLVDEPLPPLDWGDLQDTSTGTGPYDYQTISGDSGPNHIIVSGLRLGAAVDDEFDGQPYFDATGDDAAGSTPDDEDGVTFLTPLAAGTNADVQFNVNAPDGDACVSLFADFTADGDFADSGEHAVNQQTYATGNQTATIVVPAAAEARIAVRVRLTDECSQGGELPTGAALNGEVEDYMLGAIGDFVWPDLNANGNQEFFEQGVNGVVVNLLDGNGNPVLDGDGNPITTTTANDVIANPGYYAFGGLPPGTYIVEFVAPAGQDFTIQNHPGSSEPADSDADTTTGRADPVTIGAGEVNNDIDAGLVDEPPAPTYDFGDLPDTGSGVGAGNYETLLANNGPSHVIVSGLGLAFSPDDESDGQPNATATGDDTAGASPDDEDGVSFMWPLVAGTTAGIAPSAIDSDTIACVSVYVDFNGDGDFADTDEHLINQINFGLGAGGTGVYWFNVPSTARGAIAVRARLTDECNQGGESPNGAALNGEVEDYILGAIGNYVWNDSDGDGTQDEPASAGQNGVTVKLLDGSGNQMTDYDGDPITTTTANDSSGNPGYYEFAGLPAGNYIVEFVAPSGKDFTQTGQGTAATDSDANVSTGRSGVVAISAGEVDNTIDAGLINEPPALTYDFGDLPDTGSGTGVGNYQTLSGDSGPRHTIAGGVTLGAAVDAEADGQPNATATGDDANGSPDDEDGVSFPVLSPGSSGYIVVNTVDDDATACVNVFIDYNADGDFADADEHVISNSASLGTGTNNFYVTAPATATGLMGARVRVTDGCGQGGQSPTGNATTGEVEDYILGAIGDYVWNDLDGDGAQDEPASAGQNGVVVRLYYDLGASGVFFAATTTTANDSSGNPGYYEFPGLPVGNYIVEFVAPAGKQFTTADATADDQDSDANTTTGRTASTAISAGELDPTIDAGLITVLDFGDLPDTGAGTGAANYQTLSSDSGPSHAIVTGLRFGATIDDESDGQPNATASGDGADEDGLGFPTPLVAGRPVNLTLNGGAAADNQYCINLFADFNSDGDFADSGEHAISESLRSTGSQGLVFSSPSTATGAIGVRVRMTDACGQNGNSPTGAAVNGEVEDYLLGAIGDYVWFDANSDGVQNEPANQGQDGVVVRLLDGLGNPVLDGNGSAITTTTATRNGNPGYYEFAGLPAGNYIVEFVAPAGQDFTQTGQGTAATDSDANVSTGRSGLINLSAGEVDDTIDAGLVNEPVTGTCNQSDADYLLTNIIGAGMGSMTKHKASQRMVIPNWQTVDSLYAQLAGKQNGLPKYVRFMYTAKNYIQDEVIDSPASQTYAVFWYGEELDPAPAITGRWFLNKVSTKNHVPRALVLYPTYRTTVPYINVFEPIQAADTQVYWNTAAGWVPTTSYTLDIPAPLAPATLTVKVAQVDNDKDERPVSITVTAGGVSVTQSPVAPNSGDQLDILTFVLPNVPAGTNEVVITSVSYGPNTNGLGALGGDSTAIIGATANYACN